MSAGWKKNCSCGKCRGSCRRSIAVRSAVAVCPFSREIRISPSMGPTVAESLSERLIPLYGSPMLSRITLICCAPTSCLMRLSTAAKSCCVLSRRVPGGARTCRRICPASTCGKKSRPSSGNSSSETSIKPRKAPPAYLGNARHQDNALR